MKSNVLLHNPRPDGQSSVFLNCEFASAFSKPKQLGVLGYLASSQRAKV
jgi:hypothetical protein